MSYEIFQNKQLTQEPFIRVGKNGIGVLGAAIKRRLPNGIELLIDREARKFALRGDKERGYRGKTIDMLSLLVALGLRHWNISQRFYGHWTKVDGAWMVEFSVADQSWAKLL